MVLRTQEQIQREKDSVAHEMMYEHSGNDFVEAMGRTVKAASSLQAYMLYMTFPIMWNTWHTRYMCRSVDSRNMKYLVYWPSIDRYRCMFPRWSTCKEIEGAERYLTKEVAVTEGERSQKICDDYRVFEIKEVLR